MKEKGTADPDFHLLDFVIWSPMSWFSFGYPRQAGSYKSWILQFRDAYGVRESWAANRWVHLCLAYEKRTGFLRVVRVSTVLCLVVPRLLQLTKLNFDCLYSRTEKCHSATTTLIPT